MKPFFAFVKKETFHILRDVRTLLILLGMPIAQVIIFGFAITNELQDVKLAILDQSKDQASRELTSRIISSDFFVLSQNLNSTEDIESSFKKGKVKLAVIFPPDFQNQMYKVEGTQVQVIADASDPNTATSLINYVQAIVRSYQMELSPMASKPLMINTEVKMLYNNEMKSVFMFVPGVITIILMLVSAMMTSIAIAREKEIGTMEILLVSPLRPALIIVGKVVPYIALALLNAVIIIALAYFIFGMPINGSLALLLLECLIFVLTALALGILISTKTSSQQVALLVSIMGLLLPTILLSGFIFPIENMPNVLQWISNLIPARWFIIIVKDIMLKGVGMAYVWKETLILVGMMLFFLIVSVKNFKIRLA